MVSGDFGFRQITKEFFQNSDIIAMMGKLHFEVDPKIDAQFPEKRICRATILTKDGKQFDSSECEPPGEASENIGIEWISEKFKRITEPVITSEAQKTFLSLMIQDSEQSVCKMVDIFNQKEFWKNETIY